MGGSRASTLRRYGVAVVALDAAVVCAATVLAAVLGESNRTAVGSLTFIAGGLLMVVGPILMGALPLMGTGLHGMNYTNILHSEMLLQQSLRDEHVAADLGKRRRAGLTLLASGFSLLFVAMAVIG